MSDLFRMQLRARRGLSIVAAAVACTAACTLPAQAASTTGSPTWQVAQVFTGQPISNLNMITAAGPTQAWAFGVSGSSSSPAAEHWDGTSWTESLLPGITQPPQSVSATGKSNVWAGGGGGPSGTKPYVLRWNGAQWRLKTFPLGSTPSVVLTTGAADGWLFDNSSGTTLHYTGATWQPVTLPNGYSDVLSAAAINKTNAYAAIASLFLFDTGILHWNGTSWSHIFIPEAPLPSSQLSFPEQLVTTGGQIFVTVDVLDKSTNAVVPGISYLLWGNGTKWRWIRVPYQDRAVNLAPDGHGGVWMDAVTSSATPSYDFVNYNTGTWTRQPAPSPVTAVYGLSLIPGTQTLWASGDETVNGTVTPAILKYGP
jgi:hypothetical protein